MNQGRFTLPFLFRGRWLVAVLSSLFLIGVMTDYRPLHASPLAQEDVNPHSEETVNADEFDEDGWSLNLGYPGIDGYVRGMKVIDGDLYLWGDLRRVGGIAVKQMAKLSGQTGAWSNLDFDQPVNVYDLLVSGNQIYLAGRIQINGTDHGVVIYDDGKMTPLGGAFNGDVHAMAWHQGQLYATGAFTQIGGVTIYRIARWNGTQWEALGSGLLGFDDVPEGKALISTGDTLYVAGRFRVVGGVAARNLAAWQGNQWRNVYDVEGEVLSLAWDGASLYVGTTYTNIGGETQIGIIRIQNNQPYPVGRGLSFGANVHAILPVQGGVYVAGREFYYGVNADGSHTPLTNVAFFDGTRWYAMGENFGGSSYGSKATIQWLGLWQGKVAAAGDMERLGTRSFQSLALWDGVQWSRPPINPGIFTGVNGPVRDMFIHADNLYVVGGFSLAGTLDVPGLARWDGTTWYSVADGTLGGLQSAQWVVANQSGIYIGGPHRLDDGIQMWNVAHWDGASWRLIGDNLNGVITRLYTDDGQALYISGLFRPYGPAEIYGAGQWDGAQWFFYRNVRQSGWVDEIAAINGTIYGCGQALSTDDQMLSTLARWGGDHWESILPDTVSPNCDFTVDGDSLYLRATLIKAYPETNVEAILRITGSQWEVIPQPESISLFSLMYSQNRDLFSYSTQDLPQQFKEANEFIPRANLHWRPANGQQFLPVPRSNLVSFIISRASAVVYKEMLLLGGIEVSYPPPAYYLNAWRAPTADVAASLSSPNAVKVGSTLPLTASLTLLTGSSAPYVMADLRIKSQDAAIQSMTSAQCTNANQPQSVFQCAWRMLREGNAAHAHFTVTPSYIGEVEVEIASWWSGRDPNSDNNRATRTVDVYDSFPATPDGGNFFFWFGSDNRLDLRIPAAAISTPLELYLSQEIAPSPGQGLATGEPIFQISPISARSDETTVFNSPIAATLRYTEADLYRIFEETAVLHRYDAQRAEWIPSHEECEEAAPSVVNPEQNQVQASICRTGLYALIGEAKPLLFLPRISQGQ